MAELRRENTVGGNEHALSLSARAHAEITGVVEVSSFDETVVVLDTVCGALTLEGRGLRVGTLDLARGVLAVDGKIDALYYSDTKESRKKSFFSGLFHVDDH